MSVSTQRADHLAEQLRHEAAKLAALAAGLSDVEWRTTAVNNPEIVVGDQDENRPVGVVVHHVADWMERMIPLLDDAAEGRDGQRLDAAGIDAVNAEHHADHPEPDQTATVALLKAAAEAAASRVATLDDAALDRPREGRAATTQAFIEMVVIGHIGWHRGSIVATFAH